MWPTSLFLLSRPLDRRDLCAAVITEIAVTVGTVVVVGSAVIAEISGSVITATAVTAVTVDIVAQGAPGAAGMSERPVQRVLQRCRFVDDEP